MYETSTLRLRAATMDDLPAVHAVAMRAAKRDDTGELFELEDLREEWRRVGFDPTTDVLLALDEEGDLLGYAEAGVSSAPRDGEIRAHVMGVTDPAFRGRGVASALLPWCLERARAKAQRDHPGVPVVVAAWGRQEDSDSAALLADAGMTPARYFSDMRVTLADWEDPGTPLPVGARAPRDGDEEAVRLTHNEAFADHWGSSDQTPERWGDMWRRRVGRPQLSRIAVGDASDGLGERVLAYVLTQEWQEGEAYVALVGTARAARGRHLATALLTDVVRACRDAGLRRVELGVDAASPTGANGVYERVGFSVVRRGVSMALPAWTPPAG